MKVKVRYKNINEAENLTYEGFRKVAQTWRDALSGPSRFTEVFTFKANQPIVVPGPPREPYSPFRFRADDPPPQRVKVIECEYCGHLHRAAADRLHCKQCLAPLPRQVEVIEYGYCEYSSSKGRCL